MSYFSSHFQIWQYKFLKKSDFKHDFKHDALNFEDQDESLPNFKERYKESCVDKGTGLRFNYLLLP